MLDFMEDVIPCPFMDNVVVITGDNLDHSRCV